jgi:hypothetical protein
MNKLIYFIGTANDVVIHHLIQFYNWSIADEPSIDVHKNQDKHVI